VKIFVTKYALTTGIEELNLPNDYNGDDGYFSYTEKDPWRDHFYSPKEWYTSRKAAVARAKEMQAAKLKSIDKQRKRIAALTFDKP
jgi:hypothetical protein